MKELTKNDILKNRVDTISQYKILDYLKKNLNIDEFKIYLVDRDNIKVIDRTDDVLYFHYDGNTKEIPYQDKLIEKEKEFEIGL